MQRVAEMQAQESRSLSGFVIVCSVVFIAFQIVEISAALALPVLPDSADRYFLQYGYFLWVLPGLFVILCARQFSWPGLTAGIFSLVLGYIVLTQSRGLWIWPGTFDKVAHEEGSWRSMLIYSSLLLSIVASIVAAVTKKKPPLSDESIARYSKRASWTLLASVVITGFLHLSNDVDSVFPPTRPVFLFLIAGVLLFFNLKARQNSPINIG